MDSTTAPNGIDAQDSAGMREPTAKNQNFISVMIFPNSVSSSVKFKNWGRLGAGSYPSGPGSGEFGWGGGGGGRAGFGEGSVGGSRAPAGCIRQRIHQCCARNKVFLQAAATPMTETHCHHRSFLMATVV